MKKHINLQQYVLLNTILFIIHFFNADTAVATLLVYAMACIAIVTICHTLYIRYGQEALSKPGWLMLGRQRTILFVYACFSLIMSLLYTFNEVTFSILFISVIASGIALLFLHRFDETLTSFLYKTLNASNRVAIVGYDDLSRQLGSYIAQQNKYSFQGYIARDEQPVIEKAAEYMAFAAANNIRELYAHSDQFTQTDITTLIEEANKHCIRLRLVSGKSAANIASFTHTEHFNNWLLLKEYNEPLTSLKNRIAKRLYDCIISSLVIILILSWLVPLIGLLIKLESKGPVFFRQMRSGRNNQSFLCYKFRTMVSNADSDQKQATRDDARITKIGAFLRRTSLDELPQFINVLKNEMSITGPRPHMLRHTEEYSSQIKEYMTRLYVKPGLTGWAQVNGFRGETPDLYSMQKRIEHDLWYLQNWSLALDIKIFFRTIINIIRREENAF